MISASGFVAFDSHKPLKNTYMRRLFAITVSLAVLFAIHDPAFAQFSDFITVKGDKLMDGGKEFRFISFNVPTLHYIEDNLPFAEPNAFRFANEFEITDALVTIKQAGGQAVRIYTPSIRKETDDSSVVRHIYGPGRFDEEGFRIYDKVLEIANTIGIRVIISFLDNWWWWGGPKEYAAFRGKEKQEFWTDSTLIADFRLTVDHILKRVNTITGVPYKDDQAILCWETGNELECPTAWNIATARYIKSLDTHHLVMEGSHTRFIPQEYLDEPAIDIVQTHHYDRAPAIIDYVLANRKSARERKPYIVGEFGFIPVKDMEVLLDSVISSGTNGIMIWSLRQHNRDGGFYYHTNAYRWPGFPSGNAWEEMAVTSLIHRKASEISGITPSPIPIPEPPRLLPIATPYKITWQGSTGASSYVIERKEDKPDAEWKLIASDASDANAAYRPLFSDTTAQVETNYLYRVSATSQSGTSQPSSPYGPVSMDSKMLIDEMANDSKFFAKSGNLQFLTLETIARAKEDRDRLVGSTGEYVVYRLTDSIASVNVEVLAVRLDGDVDVVISSGASPDSLSRLDVRRDIHQNFKNEYGFFTPISYFCDRVPPQHRYVKIVLADNSQIGHIEIVYGAPSSAPKAHR